MRALTLDRDGLVYLPGAVRDILESLKAAIAALPADRAGIRLRGVERLRPHLASDGAIGAAAATLLGATSRPVRAILFDKSPAMNWSLGWHQDRTICVERRIDTPGFGPWTRKQGLVHVTPPFDLLAGMITARVHLDPVPIDNAPLLVAPGSHRLGRLAEGAIGAAVRRCGSYACLADAGDIWLYSTPILHASHAARVHSRRRVLQIDFAAIDLPGDLRWLGA